MIKKIVILIIFILCGLTAYKVFLYFEKKKINSSEIQLVPVEAAKVEKKNIWDTIEVTGEVHGYLEAKVFSPVPGKVNSRVKLTGSRVEKNEVIIKIDRDEPAMEFSLVKIKSPLRGVITRYFVNEGETVFPSFPLAEIASIEKIKIIVQIAEKDFSKIQNGLNAVFFVDAYPNVTFKGQLNNVSQSLDSLTRTISADIIASNIGYQLKPGMFAKVEIFSKEYAEALIIPQEAVMYNPGADSNVFVLNPDKTVSLRTVRTGLFTKGYVQILSGLAEGEEVVTVGQYNLEEGLKVNVVPKTNSFSVQNQNRETSGNKK